MNKYRRRLMTDFSFMTYAPSVLFQQTGRRINRIIELVNYVYNSCTFRISTGVLNDVLADAIAVNEPPQTREEGLKYFMEPRFP